MSVNVSTTKNSTAISVSGGGVSVAASGGVGPQGPAGPAGSNGVTSLNSLTGAVTLAVVGGTLSTAGNTLTLTVSGGGGGAVSSVAGRTGDVVLTVADVSGAVSTSDSRLTDSREWSATTVTQADAEAGAATTRVAWTVQRVWQAIAAWWAASADKTKLDGIAAGATANQTDAHLLARANHTGTQAHTTITGLGTLATQSGTFSGTSSGTNTGDQTITLTGDVTGSGTGSFAATLSASGVAAGTYTSVTVDAKGRVTAGSSPAVAYSSLSGVPSTFAPSAHKASHATGGSDALAAADIGAASSSHAHGNLTNAGAIGATSGQIVVTTTSGVLTTAATISAATQVSGLATIATSGSASDLGAGTVPAACLPLATVAAAGAVIVGTGLGVSSGTVSVSYGTTSATACAGNDSRLSDARMTPMQHLSFTRGGSAPSGWTVASNVFSGTVPTGAKMLLIQMYGGGGGGGGGSRRPSGNTSAYSGGGGGGSAYYQEVTIDVTALAGQDVKVYCGAGGAGGAGATSDGAGSAGAAGERSYVGVGTTQLYHQADGGAGGVATSTTAAAGGASGATGSLGRSAGHSGGSSSLTATAAAGTRGVGVGSSGAAGGAITGASTSYAGGAGSQVRFLYTTGLTTISGVGTGNDVAGGTAGGGNGTTAGAYTGGAGGGGNASGAGGNGSAASDNYGAGGGGGGAGQNPSNGGSGGAGGHGSAELTFLF